MFVGAGDFFDVFGRDLRFVAGSFFGDALAQDFGLGLQVNDEIGGGNACGERFVIALVELELAVVEVEIGKDAVFFEKKVGEHRAGSLHAQGFAQALPALEEEIHLGAKSSPGLGLIEIGKERVVFAIVDAAGVEAFGKDAGEGAFADAQRAFDDDETRSLGAALRNASALGGGGIVARHRGARPQAERG